METNASTSTHESEKVTGTQPDEGVVDIKDAALEAAASVNKLYQVSHDFLHRQARERPYVVLGAAAGIGFILGGGLASRFTGVLLTVGGRMLASELTKARSEQS